MIQFLSTPASRYMLSDLNAGSRTTFEIHFPTRQDAQVFARQIQFSIVEIWEMNSASIEEHIQDLETSSDALAAYVRDVQTWVTLDEEAAVTRIRFPHSLFDAQGACLFLDQCLANIKESSHKELGEIKTSVGDDHQIYTRHFDSDSQSDHTVLQVFIDEIKELLPERVRLLVAQSSREPGQLSIGNNFLFLTFARNELERISKWPKVNWRRFLNTQIRTLQKQSLSPEAIQSAMSSEPLLILTNPGQISGKGLKEIEKLNSFFLLSERVPYSQGIIVLSSIGSKMFAVFSEMSADQKRIDGLMTAKGWEKVR